MFLKQLKKLPVYCLGLLILALGISFSVKSNLGVSPITSIGYVLSLVLEMDLGISVTISYLGFMALQIVFLGRNYQWHNLLQLVGSFAFGFFVDFANYLVRAVPVAENILVQLVFCFLGIVLVGIGLHLYTGCHLLALPSEGLMAAMVTRFKLKKSNAKIIQDCSVVGVSLVLSLLCLGRVDGLGLGTLLTALGVGNVLKCIEKLLHKLGERTQAPQGEMG